MQMKLMDIVKKALTKGETFVLSRKDVVVKSKDRNASKALMEQYLKKNKIPYTDVFKKSKSSSLNVLSVLDGDIIFKPVIQKGAGGLKFEKELEADLRNYFNGAEMKDLRHQDVVKELEKTLGFNQKPNNGTKIIPEGSKNQKRALTFNGGKISISNTTGKTLTDLTVEHNKKIYYLSLKMSATYYTLSASIFQYFLNTATQVQMNEYFGFDGSKMGGFGKEYECITKLPDYSKVKRNLADLLGQAYGREVIIVHKKTAGDVLVTPVGAQPKVTINQLDVNSYVYPEAGKRKYANIKTVATINNHKYKVDFQFRGTTAADVGPKYLRILMERL